MSNKQFDNTNRGILSKNERKEKDTHPSHKGSLNVDGVEYWLDAWTQERKDGSGRFFSLSVKRKDAQQGQAPAPKAPPPSSGGGASDDDDIPFANPLAGKAWLVS